MDSKCAENIVIYDWLSFTSKVHTPQDLIRELGLSDVHWEDTKGARGYRSRKYFNCISIHYDGRADMGVWVEMSGQGCRAFETVSQLGWDKLFKFIRENGLKITRLDVAYDDHVGLLNMNEIIGDTMNGMFVSKSNYWETIMSSKGSSVQIGSPQSRVLFRIYDKAAERGKTDEHWIRVEAQMRDDRAIQFSKIPLPIGEAFAGVLLNYLRYVTPTEDENRWRWPMTDYWEALVADASRISIYRSPGMEYNEARLRNYVFNQAGNAIDCALQLYGTNDFMALLRARDAKPNPKYENLLRNSRFEALMGRVSRFFGESAIV